MKRCVPLDPAAEAVAAQNDQPPYLYRLPPEEGRQALERAQKAPVYQYPAKIMRCRVDTGRWGTIPVFFVLPEENPPRRVILYLHGGGWVFGSLRTHEKLARELVARTDSLLVFPEYSRAPEAQYPIAVEQCYAVLNHLTEILSDCFPDLSSLPVMVAGDSVGGNLSIVMALLVKERRGPKVEKLLLYYPVTDACFDTPSYRQFACHYSLTRAGMEWFWEKYAPNRADRAKITASPLRAGIDQLRGLPETMLINGEADVLLSEGEAFGKKLRCAGVPVTALRVQGTVHDFVMLNALDRSNATRTAMDASTAWINRAL